MTASERDFRFEILTRIGCIACRIKHGFHIPPVIHHIMGITSSRQGLGGKADDRETIPLCPAHHDKHGIGLSLHDGVKTWEAIYGTQQELLESVNKLISRMN